VKQSTADVYTTWQVEHWCKSTGDVDKALSVPYQPADYDASDLGRVRAELGDHGLVMASVGDPAYLAADLMSFQDFLMWAFAATDHFARTVERLAERVMENLRRQLDCCVVDLYRIVGPEYFTPPYLPPAMFERFVVPHASAMTRLIHARGGKVRLHCHGKIGRVLDLVLETGCDGVDPCEPPPDGDLELDEVKRRCRARGVSVWGNLELKLLENGTPDQVRAEVRKVMSQAKDGGGFVLMPTAAPIGLPLAPGTEANYRAFIEAGLELGRY
jgi:uroporphyrinogen-III decarboxylase